MLIKIRCKSADKILLNDKNTMGRNDYKNIFIPTLQ